MRTWIVLFAGAGLLLAAPGAAHAYDEGVSGDLSNSAGAPTPLPFALGTNVVTGSVRSTVPTDMRDYVTFSIPAGQRLSGLRLTSWTGNNRGFHAINSGATSFEPSGATAGSFLGGDHVDPDDAGADLLPRLADAQTDGTPVGTGFTPPLGPGTYSYVIQQTSGTSTYGLEFIVTAAPAAATGVPAMSGWSIAGLIAALLAAGVLQRRRGRVAA